MRRRRRAAANKRVVTCANRHARVHDIVPCLSPELTQGRVDEGACRLGFAHYLVLRGLRLVRGLCRAPFLADTSTVDLGLLGDLEILLGSGDSGPSPCTDRNANAADCTKDWSSTAGRATVRLLEAGHWASKAQGTNPRS